jgi:16S rRNA C1402 N4-methylase RsmH
MRWRREAYGPSVGAHPGRSREARSNVRPRGMVVTRKGTEPGLQADWHFLSGLALACSRMSHAPVLLAEAMDALALKPSGVYVDATFGGGGYSRVMLESGALVIAYDRDPDAIVREREATPITRTLQLAQIVEDSVGGRKGARTHPATKTFQALRMLVNDELGELARGLSAAERALKPGGRLAVVSFHSLEDRMVKRFITERADAQGRGSRYTPDAPPLRAPSFKLEEKRATQSSDEETDANPRARSARLRWAVRTDAPAWDELEQPALAPRAEAEWTKLS